MYKLQTTANYRLAYLQNLLDQFILLCALLASDFTSLEQRLLFNKVIKRLRLKLACYEQHETNHTFYYKCRPNIDAAFYERFHQQWKGLLTATSRKVIILLKQECHNL